MTPESPPLRVLIVEDSEDDAELILIELRRAGFRLQYRCVQTPDEMERALDSQEWDIVISDFSMPHFSALGALGQLHEHKLDVPFIIVSGAIGEETAVICMKGGAHDYVMKGNLARLVPIVHRELREAGERYARRLAEQALASSEQRYRTIVDTANDGIVATDVENCITYVNDRMRELLGYEGRELELRPFTDLIHPDDRDEWLQRFEQIRAGARLQFDLRLQRKDGVQIWALNSCSPLPDANGSFAGAISMLRDVTERKRAEEALAHQALHDALTGLPNRSLLHDRLDQAILAARREHWPLALLLIDLDRFKEVNDTFGHHYGDILLKQVGPRLRDALRESDTVSRLGGDEFAVILAGCDVDSAKITASKLLKALEEPFLVEGQGLNVSGSIGIVAYPEHGQDVETLMRRVDVAMYTAKRDHEGFSQYAAEQDEHSATRLTLTNQLRTSIENGELLMYYQPKISLATQKLVDVEALVRWQHSERGIIAPDHFIPLAEQSGLIKPLTRWVLGAVMNQCCGWRATGLEIGVSVNLSMRNLHDPQLPELFAELLESSHLPPDALQAEITETVLMTNAGRTMDVVTRLSAMGIHLSIDDFGTGYSSLAYLKRLPVHEIKIDKSFVSDMTTNENDAVIVRSTIDLGHNLGLKVVAEGVETEEAWDRLVDLGCDLAQGYYMALPMPAAELEQWVASSPWGLGNGHPLVDGRRNGHDASDDEQLAQPV